MADTLMGVTETSAAGVDQISSMVQMYLQQESKMIPLVQNFSGLVNKGDKSVNIPRSGGFTVSAKGENTAADAQDITYAVDSIALDQHRQVQFLIEDIANEQAVPAIVEDALRKAAKDMARDVDQIIINELELASASAPDHRLAYANNPTDTIQETDILGARKLLIEQYINPQECFMGIAPDQEEAMLKLTNFIDASKFGNETIPSGVIGRVFGLNVVVHNDFESLKTMIWHPTALGYAAQFGPRVQSDYDLANLGWRYSIDQLFGVKHLDAGKRAVLLGTAA